MPTISSFPILDAEFFQRIRLQPSPFRFFYKDEMGEEQELVAEDNGSSLHPLVDDKGKWSADLNGFSVTRSYSIRSASFLFGNGGVACKSATLSLAVLCKSPDSRQRFAKEIGEISNSPEYQSFVMNLDFPNPCFKGRLDFQTAIVIKKGGIPSEDESHLANMPGTVLGIFDTYSVLFDGVGSMFPINVISDKNGLLWSVDCSFDDPLSDKFIDTVSINLNSAHRDYMFIDQNDRNNFNPSFLREVLAGALATIVDCVRETESWDDIKNGRYEEESVAQAVSYFLTTLNLSLDDAKQCSVSFRELLEQKLGAL